MYSVVVAASVVLSPGTGHSIMRKPDGSAHTLALARTLKVTHNQTHTHTHNLTASPAVAVPHHALSI